MQQSRLAEGPRGAKGVQADYRRLLPHGLRAVRGSSASVGAASEERLVRAIRS